MRIKPCPKCGSKDLKRSLLIPPDSLMCGGTIRCRNCNMFFYQTFMQDDLVKDALVKSWNKLKPGDVVELYPEVKDESS